MTFVSVVEAKPPGVERCECESLRIEDFEYIRVTVWKVTKVQVRGNQRARGVIVPHVYKGELTCFGLSGILTFSL